MGSRTTADKQYRSLVKEITRLRKAAGITQVEFAAAIGTDQSQFSKYERCERRIGLADFAKICRVLKVDPRKLLSILD